MSPELYIVEKVFFTVGTGMRRSRLVTPEEYVRYAREAKVDGFVDFNYVTYESGRRVEVEGIVKRKTPTDESGSL